MLAPETVAFLEGGCSLVVGTVSAAGEPHASRGWGVTVVHPGGEDGDVARLRLLIDVDDAVALENLSTTKAVATTAGDVRTLHSMQLKGVAVGIEPSTEQDRSRLSRFCEAFFGEVHGVDGIARALLDQLAPLDVAACTLRITELYDQTPGPAAGTSIPPGESDAGSAS